MLKSILLVCFIITEAIICCGKTSTEHQQQWQVRKANPTQRLCEFMMPPECINNVYNRKKLCDYSVIAQLVLKRSVNFSFVGTRQKMVSIVLAQVRINGTPAGRFEVYGDEYYVDCPPGTMVT